MGEVQLFVFPACLPQLWAADKGQFPNLEQGAVPSPGRERFPGLEGGRRLV